MTISNKIINGVEILTLENEQLAVSLAPALGGKILSVYNKELCKEFVWTNKDLIISTNPPGSDYDSNFFGGIDELIPNDLPETIDSINYPDHGELWTTPLQSEVIGNEIKVHGKLGLSGLYYGKTVHLDKEHPVIILDYNIKNEAGQLRHFLWKLHAALNIAPGDKLETAAVRGQVIDPAYSRFTTLREFNWPAIENMDASLVPGNNKTMDFFYLSDIPFGEMKMISGEEEHLFSYRYDNSVFPYQWYFASYGGFLNHYTAILEPCTNMPMSVKEAKEKNQCAFLQPGEALTTTVRIFAGYKKNYTP
jgi:Domain of unknown function (DUF5107)